MNELVHFSIRVSATMKRKVARVAKAEGHHSNSVVVRNALAYYFQDHQAPDKVRRRDDGRTRP